MLLVSVSKLILLLFQSLIQGQYHLYIMEDNYTEPANKDDVPPRDWITSIDDTMQNYIGGLSPKHSRPWKDVDYVSCI